MSTGRVVPVDDPGIEWGDQAVGRYALALAKLGAEGALTNACFDLAALQLRDRAFLLVLPRGRQGCWLTAPSVAYGAALRDEIPRLSGPMGSAMLARWASHLVEGLLRTTRADQAVHVNHLLFSTSLYGRWTGEALANALAALRRAFPDRAILWRSLNVADHTPLLAAMEAAGARRMLSRVVWRLADPRAQWAPRTDVKADLELAAGQDITIQTDGRPSPADLRRILQLYEAIYLRKYSRTNPAYTEDAVRAAVEAGVLRLEWIRDMSGQIAAFAADHVCGSELTGPMLGHDNTRPQADGLYRIAMALSVRRALAEGLSVNYSAGADAFKRNRGATPVLEYTAVFDDHLPAWRRAGYVLLARALGALAPGLERRAAG